MPTSAHHPNPVLYDTIRTFLRFLIWLLTRTQVRGLENVPRHGPFIMVTNHLSAIDPPLCMAAMPARMTVFAADTHRHEFIAGPIMNAIGAIWVRRGEVDREALRAALEVLTSGGSMGIAPEGTRSKTGTLQEGKIGAAYLASRANVPLVPVAIAGTEIGLPALFKLSRPRITFTIGPAFKLPESNGRPSRQELARDTEIIMRAIARMLPERYRGVYGD